MKNREILKKYIKNEKIILHCIAVSKIMEGFAEYFKENKEKWKLAGLFHDIDYELTKNNPQEHGRLAIKILESEEIKDKDILEAIKKHNYFNYPETTQRDKLIEKCLIIADQLSGLIIATALVMPNKKIEEVKIETVLKKFKSKDFARSVNREIIKNEIENIRQTADPNFTLEKAIEIALNKLKEIHETLGL